MENTEKSKLNSEKKWKIWKKPKMNIEKICKIEKIWKIWKKIVKGFGQYRRKASWIVKRYGKYGWKVKMGKDMEIMEEK